MTWQQEMWKQLEAMDETEQFVASGQWITEMTRDLLPALGRHRRDAILRKTSEPGWDITRFAEEVGSRRTTISRLAEEGRAAARASRIVEEE